MRQPDVVTRGWIQKAVTEAALLVITAKVSLVRAVVSRSRSRARASLATDWRRGSRARETTRIIRISRAGGRTRRYRYARVCRDPPYIRIANRAVIFIREHDDKQQGIRAQ